MRSPVSRAERRHHEFRKKAWVRRCLPWLRDFPAAALPGRIGGLANTPAACSCWLCGNRRRHHGLTVPELRANQDGDWLLLQRRRRG